MQEGTRTISGISFRVIMIEKIYFIVDSILIIIIFFANASMILFMDAYSLKDFAQIYI